jgi:uncharacterized damage-inducible protein DinB
MKRQFLLNDLGANLMIAFLSLMFLNSIPFMLASRAASRILDKAKESKNDNHINEFAQYEELATRTQFSLMTAFEKLQTSSFISVNLPSLTELSNDLVSANELLSTRTNNDKKENVEIARHAAEAAQKFINAMKEISFNSADRTLLTTSETYLTEQKNFWRYISNLPQIDDAVGKLIREKLPIRGRLAAGLVTISFFVIFTVGYILFLFPTTNAQAGIPPFQTIQLSSIVITRLVCYIVSLTNFVPNCD